MEFIDFVLGKYVESGSEELDDAKLAVLLELKYEAVLEGAEKLGGADQARTIFVDFQKHLYKPSSEYELAVA